MNIEIETLDNAVVLKPVGRIDQNTAQAFQECLLAALDDGKHGAAVAIDMSGVDFLSSIGLRALMIGHKHCQENGARLALFALTPMVHEVFSISRFDTVLRCFDERDPALLSLTK